LEEKKNDVWVPFVSARVQMELQLYHDPVIRTKMFHLGSGLYETTFVAPDTRGSYTWQLRFRERGYNFLDGEEGN
jgi:hypothetical protein